MSLYNNPEIYDALRTPEPEDVDLVARIIDAHLDGPLQSIMDPACGPGTWLAPLANGAIRVAGNDLSAEMVGMARARFNERPSEFVLGDMRCLSFATGPFDVSLEVSGAASHLHTTDDLSALLRGMGDNVRPGGLVLLNIFFLSDPAALTAAAASGQPTITYESPARPLPSGGRAWITYSLISRDTARSTETFRRVVRIEGPGGGAGGGVPGAGPVIEDEYALRVWSVPEVQLAIAGAPRLRLVGVYSVLHGTRADPAPSSPGAPTHIPTTVHDEHIIALRRQ